MNYEGAMFSFEWVGGKRVTVAQAGKTGETPVQAYPFATGFERQGGVVSVGDGIPAQFQSSAEINKYFPVRPKY